MAKPRDPMQRWGEKTLGGQFWKYAQPELTRSTGSSKNIFRINWDMRAVEALRKELQSLGYKTHNKVMRKALKLAGIPIFKQMASNYKASHGKFTGNMEKATSLKSFKELKPRKNLVTLVGGPTRPLGAHSNLLEWGHDIKRGVVFSKGAWDKTGGLFKPAREKDAEGNALSLKASREIRNERAKRTVLKRTVGSRFVTKAFDSKTKEAERVFTTAVAMLMENEVNTNNKFIRFTRRDILRNA